MKIPQTEAENPYNVIEKHLGSLPEGKSMPIVILTVEPLITGEWNLPGNTMTLGGQRTARSRFPTVWDI